MRHQPGMNEDTKNLSLITGSALVAVIVTVALLSANAVRDTGTFIYEAPVAAVSYDIDMGPVSGSNRLYGEVVTRDGREYTGFIRWDKNEGSWTDLLDATKVSPMGSSTISGVRFGHVHRIEVTGRQSARFILKTGDEVMMEARATDLGTGLRALVVDAPGGYGASLDWRELDHVEFFPAPDDVLAGEARNHGTLTTRGGESFTGYVTWDIDEIYSTDVLDGEAGGSDHEIPFGAIASIERAGSSSARVVLRSGEELILRGTNDVNRSNSGITVSDVGLGQVKLEWDAFDNVRFHEPDTEPGYGLFDGGRHLVGTVVTESGEEISGEIAWDRDEAYGWEMLNGRADDVEYQIEFNNIARIAKIRGGAIVELEDGRAFGLYDSNDVDSGNRGIIVRQGGGAHEVEWRDFAELILRR